MRAYYKFLDNIDLSSNIISNVSSIIGNDYNTTNTGPHGEGYNDLLITTCDYSNSLDDNANLSTRNGGYRGDVLIRAGVGNTAANSGYVHIYAGVEEEINKDLKSATTGFADQDGIRVYPTADIRLGDARIRSYFTDEFEIHGDANNSDTFHTTYKVNGNYTAFSVTELEVADEGDNTENSKNTIRNVSDYFRIDTLHGSTAAGFLDIDTRYTDLYSSETIHIHTASRGSITPPSAFVSGQTNPAYTSSNATFLTTGYLQENVGNVIVDNSGSWVQYTGNKYEVYVGGYTQGSATARPTSLDQALYLKLDNSDTEQFSITLNNTTDVDSIAKDDFLDARADIIRLTATSKEAADGAVVTPTVNADGLIQLNAGYLDVKVNTLFGLDVNEWNLIAEDSHIRALGGGNENLGSLHLLYGEQAAEDTLTGLVFYPSGNITIGTSNSLTSQPVMWGASQTSAFVQYATNTINEWSTQTNLDIDDYLKFKVGSGTTYTAPNTATIFSLGENLTSTNGETTLDIKKGLAFLRTDDFRLNANYNTEVKIDEDSLLDIYLNESNGDDSTSAYITAQTNASVANGITLNQRKFSIARETISGNRWNSETGAFERVNNETAVVGRLDNLKVNKVFNMGMNRDKFSIYWDNYTSSLVFSQGEILWQ